ncbi:hypothetical protein GH810_00310 [Acetobacterium paludosum]|uniref:Uncharacterized protein n=1 Tax=Acetobacterium paludosum TaxID=52693 RepID=A0A923KN42_9FIRM|nr:hypothetical protein [Acetobacterium paludosum]
MFCNRIVGDRVHRCFDEYGQQPGFIFFGYVLGQQPGSGRDWGLDDALYLAKKQGRNRVEYL